MSPTTLLGPPEIDSLKPTSITPLPPADVSDSFMDLMVSKFNTTELEAPPLMGLTKNNSPTFLTTGNPCLDFFFHVVPNTPPSTFAKCLHLAWEHDALTTLKLICNLRGVGGTGKSDKEGYYTAALWLHKYHPKTLACNLGTLAEFGYLKDLLEILYRLIEGPDVRKKVKEDRLKRRNSKGGGEYGKRLRRLQRMSKGRGGYGGFRRMDYLNPYGRGMENKDSKKKKKVPRETRILAEKKRVELEKKTARENREAKKIAMAKKAVERYRRDLDYRFLYDKVSDLFSELLKMDLKYLKEGEVKKISLAAKWCPSINSSYDKSTLLLESIARKVFDRESYPEYEGVEEAHYAYRVRDRLRKEVLVPLRKALELPEVYMGTKDWGLIPYSKVASSAMKFHKKKFLKHDKLRFKEYVKKVKDEKAKMVREGDMGSKRKLKNCLAVCDVSGSMKGVPMAVSVALGVLVSEMSEEPWKGKLITFGGGAKPELQMVTGEKLKSKIRSVKQTQNGRNTDLQKVFDLILQVALNGNLREEQMIKRVFVFSDMEFDQPSGRLRADTYDSYGNADDESDDEGSTRRQRYYPGGQDPVSNTTWWETDYELIVKKFKEKGYGSAMPEIVFWNLNHSKATPVKCNKPGVALVSGYSKNLLKLFTEDSKELNPEGVMEAAIADDKYKKLVIFD